MNHEPFGKGFGIGASLSSLSLSLYNASMGCVFNGHFRNSNRLSLFVSAQRLPIPITVVQCIFFDSFFFRVHLFVQRERDN